MLLEFVLAASIHVSRHHVKSVIAGSHESMVRQNEEIDRLRLPRIVNDIQLHELEKNEELVPLYETTSFSISPVIRQDRRYVRPWTKNMVMVLADSFYRTFRIPIVLDSAVRTVEQQQQLRRVNRFAAPETGELPSSHLAGTTIDIAKRRYTYKQRQWIIAYLKDLMDRGFIVATEELYCFHICVLEKYNEI